MRILTLIFVLVAMLGLTTAQPPASENVSVLLEKAKNAGQKGNFDEAARLYREILTQKPGWLPAEFDLALTYHFSGKFPEAITWFNKVIRLDSTIANAYFLSGIDYYQINQYHSAIASLKKALELQPQNREARFYIAASEYQLNDFGNAALAYLDQIQFDSQKGDPYFQLVQCYERLEQTAVNEIESSPKANYFVLLLEAEKNIAHHQSKDAESAAKVAANIDSAAPEAWYVLGKAFQQEGEQQIAPAQFQHARYTEKNISPQFLGIIDAVLNTEGACATAGDFATAFCRASNGDLSEATRLVLAITRSNPQDARALYWSAQLYRQLAKKATATLAQISPDSPNLLKLYARAYEGAGQRNQAAGAYEQALRLDGQDASTLIEYADFRSRGQEFDKAVPLLEKAVALSPYDTQALTLLGHAYLESGQYEHAVPCFAKVLKADPGNEKVRLQLSDALHALNRLREAIAVLQAAPNDSSGRIAYMLATYYSRVGETQKARQMMRLYEQQRKRGQ